MWNPISPSSAQTGRPRKGVLDSQSVKSADHGGPRGYDAGKKIVGRKRHILVDFTGVIRSLVVTTANVQDRDGAKLVLDLAKGWFPQLRAIFADSGYAGDLIRWVKGNCPGILQTVLRPVASTGFVLLPKRWIFEQMFGWFSKYQRLTKDYENQIGRSETMIRAAMIHRMARRFEKIQSFADWLSP